MSELKRHKLRDSATMNYETAFKLINCEPKRYVHDAIGFIEAQKRTSGTFFGC